MPTSGLPEPGKRNVHLRNILFAGICLVTLYLIVSYGFPSRSSEVDSWSSHGKLETAVCTGETTTLEKTVEVTVTAMASPPKTRVSIPTELPSNPYRDLSPEHLAGNHTRTLVIAKLQSEDASWIQEALFDLLEPAGSLSTAIYTVDDQEAPHQVPINKGHEAMVYLTYIIDRYDALPDVVMFMHSHQSTWHNNDLLDASSPEIIRRLSAEKVVREGYMNLRCHWEPGCPSRIQLTVEKDDDTKMEQGLMATIFPLLFPGDAIPEVLAQPCCAQFAVSGQQIQRQSREKYILLQNWLSETDLEDSMSGRIFEYLWQYIFTRQPVHCPDMHLCYCDGYSVCFPTAHAYVQYIDIQDASKAYQEELDHWRRQFSGYLEASGGNNDGSSQPPESDRDEWLLKNIDEFESELSCRRRAAFELGQDPSRKLEILSDAWEELLAHPKGNG